MPREQLLGLATDVDRLLDAGAMASSGNENLLRRGRALRELGKKVAALNPVADAVDKVTQATGKQTGTAFLELVAMMRQVRASLSNAGMTGDLKPAVPSGPWATPQSVRDLKPLFETLSESGSGREETIKSAVERGALGDMRLLPAMLEALGDQYPPVAELVAEKVLPSLGTAVLPDLLATLDMNGKVADVRKLHTICRIDKKMGTELCRRAVKEGNPALRAKGLELLSELIPAAEVEKSALEFVNDKSKEVRHAALVALRVGKSAAVLDALCDALFTGTGQESNTAFEGLKVLPHPGTPARLLKELAAKVEESNAPPAKKSKDKVAPSAKEKQEAEAARRLTLQHAGYLIRILGTRKDGDWLAIGQALVPLATGKNVELQTAALEAVGGIGPVTSEVVPTLIAALGNKKDAVVGAAILGLRQLDPAICESAFADVLVIANRPKLDHSILDEAVLFLCGHWSAHTAQVEKLIRELLQSKSPERQSVAADAITVLGTKARNLLPTLMGTITSGTMRYSLYESFPVLDPEGEVVLPHVMGLLRNSKQTAKHEAMHVLRAYGTKAKAAVPVLTDLLESKDTYLRAWAENTLREIDR